MNAPLTPSPLPPCLQFCIMLPIVLAWAAKARLPIRQLLIPLSYCALLGGLNTTIGTSTNLVVTGQFDARVLLPSRWLNRRLLCASLCLASPAPQLVQCVA
jgi:hypothetical protein